MAPHQRISLGFSSEEKPRLTGGALHKAVLSFLPPPRTGVQQAVNLKVMKVNATAVPKTKMDPMMR